MGDKYELSATVREKVGKGAARATRRENKVPAVIYGGKKPPVAIAIAEREIDRRVYGGGFYTSLATIDIGSEKIRTLPRDFQRHPISERITHVDFMRIEDGMTLTIEIPVRFINESEAPGIKRGGVLNIVRHRISVRCPVDAIPEEIVADMTGLDINDSLHISAITLPDEVTPTISDRDFTVATVAAPAGVKEELRAAAAAAEAAELEAEALGDAGEEAAETPEEEDSAE
ncbi:MAG: 50S ribosomal protein L25/general stress protein Ctc [Alphaproteobacteria bacterium]